MGEAKKRGTYEERVVRAQQRQLEQKIRQEMLTKGHQRSGRCTGKSLLMASLMASVIPGVTR